MKLDGGGRSLAELRGRGGGGKSCREGPAAVKVRARGGMSGVWVTWLAVTERERGLEGRPVGRRARDMCVSLDKRREAKSESVLLLAKVKCYDRPAGVVEWTTNTPRI